MALIWLPMTVMAQTRHEWWTKLNIDTRPGKKWGGSLEMQYRRQANYHTTDNNVFHYPMAVILRPWVSYSLHRHWSLLLSPVGFSRSEEVPVAGNISHQTELRISAGLQHMLATRKIVFKNRVLYEARFLEPGKSQFSFQTRIRAQQWAEFLLLQTGTQTRFSVQLSHEFFVRSERAYSGFDQDRISAALAWAHLGLAWCWGYQQTVQQHSPHVIQRHQLIFAMRIII